jgi:hypothetical protein
LELEFEDRLEDELALEFEDRFDDEFELEFDDRLEDELALEFEDRFDEEFELELDEPFELELLDELDELLPATMIEPSERFVPCGTGRSSPVNTGWWRFASATVVATEATPATRIEKIFRCGFMDLLLLCGSISIRGRNGRGLALFRLELLSPPAGPRPARSFPRPAAAAAARRWR